MIDATKVTLLHHSLRPQSEVRRSEERTREDDDDDDAAAAASAALISGIPRGDPIRRTCRGAWCLPSAAVAGGRTGLRGDLFRERRRLASAPQDDDAEALGLGRIS